MRKKSLVVGMILAMSFATLTACGDSKQKYLDDVKAISEMGDAFQDMEELGDFSDIVDDMDVKTKEGKEIKKDMEELAGYMEELSDMMDDPENADTDRAAEISDKATELQKDVEDHVKAFEDAAKDAGVKDKDLEDIGF